MHNRDKKIPSKFQVPMKSTMHDSAGLLSTLESDEDLDLLSKQQEGDMFSQLSTWPVHLQGFNLGYAVSTIVEQVKTIRELSPDNDENNEMARLLQSSGVLLDEEDISARKRRKVKEENEAMMRNIYGTRDKAAALDKKRGKESELSDKTENKIKEDLSANKDQVCEKRRGRGGGRPPSSRIIEEDIEPITLGAAAKMARQKEISERGVVDSNMKTQFESAARQGQFSKFFVPRDGLSLLRIRSLLKTDKGRQRLSERVRRFDVLLQGLTVFRDIYGHHRVPVIFVVPSPNQNGDKKKCDKNVLPTSQFPTELLATIMKWPKHLYGYPLGADLSKLQNQLQQLDEQTLDQKAQERCKESLTSREDQYQNTDDGMTNSGKKVVDTYIVDSTDIGKKHQRETTAARTTAANEQWLHYKRDALISLGISLSRRRSLNFELILKALRTHDELFGDVLVPRYFIVPAEYPWDIECWGMPLGNKVRNIRYRGAYGSTEQRRALREIGFKFTYVKDGEIVYDCEGAAEDK